MLTRSERNIQYYKKWYQKNKNKKLKQRKEWANEHREELLKYYKKYHNTVRSKGILVSKLLEYYYGGLTT
jgi:hypothetical protein